GDVDRHDARESVAESKGTTAAEIATPRRCPGRRADVELDLTRSCGARNSDRGQRKKDRQEAEASMPRWGSGVPCKLVHRTARVAAGVESHNARAPSSLAGARSWRPGEGSRSVSRR